MNIHDNVKYEVTVDNKTRVMLGKFLKMAMRDGIQPSSFTEVTYGLKINLEKDKKVYTVTFDSEGVLDTVECKGKLLTLKNKAVKSILANAEKIKQGITPQGFTRV